MISSAKTLRRIAGLLASSLVVHTRLKLAMVSKECQEAFRYKDICFLCFFLVLLLQGLVNTMHQARFALSPHVTYHRLVKHLLICMAFQADVTLHFALQGHAHLKEGGSDPPSV